LIFRGRRDGDWGFWWRYIGSFEQVVRLIYVCNVVGQSPLPKICDLGENDGGPGRIALPGFPTTNDPLK
jgi:hypothetical protein